MKAVLFFLLVLFGGLELSCDENYMKPAVPKVENIKKADVDTTGVYYHLRHDDVQSAKRELNRLKRENLGWTPGAKLLRYIWKKEQELKNPKLYKAIKKLRAITPEKSKGIEKDRLNELSEIVLKNENDEGALLLGWIYYNRGDFKEAGTFFKAVKKRELRNAQKGLILACEKGALSSAESGLFQEAKTYARECLDADFQNDIYERVGWVLYDKGEYGRAEEFFGRQTPKNAQSLYGQILSIEKSGEKNRAVSFSCENRKISQKIYSYCTGVVSEKILKSYNDKNYESVVTGYDYLQSIDGESYEMMPLAGWALLNLEKNGEAAKVFDRLLEKDPKNEEYAFGLIKSLEGREDALHAARIKYAVVKRLLKEKRYKEFRDREQYDLAKRVSGKQLSAKIVSDMRLESGVDLFSKTGDEGTSRLKVTTPFIAFSALVKNIRLKAVLEKKQLDGGTLNDGSNTGNRIAQDDYDRSYDTTVPTICGKLEKEGITYFGSFGTTPVGGEISEKFVGDLGFKLYTETSLYRMRFYSQPKEESILSYTGLFDAVAQKKWGQVTQDGVSLQTSHFASGIGYSLTGEYANLTGVNVKTNRFFSLRGDAAKDIVKNVSSDFFKYLRAGPYLSYFSYGDNQNHYTYGHGGYFSPQSYTSGGVMIDALGISDKRAIYNLQASVGYTTHKSDAEHYYLQKDASTLSGNYLYESDEESGLTGNLRVRATKMLNSDFSLNYYGYLNMSNGYEEYSAGAYIKYYFDKKSTLTKADLPFSFYKY